MRFTVGYILVLVAAVLLLAHQMVPHCHCPIGSTTETCTDEQEADHGIWDAIFGTDLGANHLQNYSISQSQNTAPQLLFVSLYFFVPQSLSFAIPHNVIAVGREQISIPIKLRGHIARFTLRPPPQA